MTLVEIKKAAANLSNEEKVDLISYLTSNTDDGIILSDADKLELDRISEGVRNGTIQTKTYKDVRSTVREKYGI